MGRHSAAPVLEKTRPFQDDPAPITDPRLFDSPLPMVRPAAQQPAPAAMSRPVVGLREVADARPQIRTAVQPTVLLAEDLGVDDIEAGGSPFHPRSVRGAAPRGVDRVVPQMAGSSLLGLTRQESRPVRPQDQRYARTGPIPIVIDEDEDEQPARRPSAFSRRREIALAAAAVAVVGAVSGVAAILPSASDAAQASAKYTTPMPGASGATGQTCISPIQLKQAMRRHHHRVHPIAARPQGTAAATGSAAPSSSASSKPSSSSSPTASSSPSSSSTPSDTSSSSTPAVPTTGLDLLGIVKTALASSMLGLNTGTYVLHDFSSQSHGVTLGKVGLQGAGIDKTVIEMAPHSSTKAGLVPTADLTTNPLYLMSTIGGTPGLHGFTLKGTDQGHLYGGLFVGQTTNARVSDVKITDIPGNKNYPPGETFSLNDWRTDGSVYNNIHIDGGGTAAVDFGSNSTTNITVNNSVFTGTKYSSAMAMWQTKNITLNDVTLKDNRSGINFERASGNITINRPVLSNNGLYDFQFGTDQDGGNVVINDPVLAAGQKIVINAPLQYHGVTNGQKRANIHVYVNGVDKTSSLVQYR